MAEEITVCGQRSLAHVTKNKKYVNEETKTNKRHCPVRPAQVQN